MTPSDRTKKRGVKIVWFGFSERGPKLKTTLHGDLLLMVDKCIFFKTLQQICSQGTGRTWVAYHR